MTTKNPPRPPLAKGGVRAAFLRLLNVVAKSTSAIAVFETRDKRKNSAAPFMTGVTNGAKLVSVFVNRLFLALFPPFWKRGK
jgi:hypothetical protein